MRSAKTLGLLLATLILAACTPSKEEKVKLGLACSVRACICQSTTLTAKPQKVLWRQNGEAYCPEGFRLRITEKKKDFKSSYGG